MSHFLSRRRIGSMKKPIESEAIAMRFAKEAAALLEQFARAAESLNKANARRPSDAKVIRAPRSMNRAR